MTKTNVQPGDPTPAPEDIEAPAPTDQSPEDPGIPHSDGSTFSDGSGYA